MLWENKAEGVRCAEQSACEVLFRFFHKTHFPYPGQGEEANVHAHTLIGFGGSVKETAVAGWSRRW